MGIHIDLVTWYTNPNSIPVANMGIIVASEKCTSGKQGTALTATPTYRPVPCCDVPRIETP